MKNLSKDKSWALARSVALSLVPQLNASPSLVTKCLTALRNNDGLTLAGLAVRPGDYSSASSYRNDAQCVDLLRKFMHLPSGIDTRAVALSGFIGWENWCRNVNDALSDAFCFTGDESTNSRITALDRARGLIKTILGKAPRLETLSFQFGPGATSQCRSNVPKSQKYAHKVHSTRRLARAWLANASDAGPVQPLAVRYGMYPWEIRESDKIDTVAKTAKTDRSIGIPVHLNAFVQRGVGIAIKQKLDNYTGLNLSDVPEYHALLAGVAHVDGLSTIDLSSASDTISFVLVKQLLPPDWFDLLMLCRVDYYDLNGEQRAYEKFSAMGNGFTFELETLLFYALAVVASADQKQTTPSAVKHEVSVFGDDIICQRSAAGGVIKLLNDAGFIVNAEKTFLDGAFFESCGADYFDGFAVRSVFLKDLSTPQDVIVFANMVTTLSQRASDGLYRCKRFKKSYDILVTSLKSWFAVDFSVCKVPSGYSHGLVSSFDEALPTLVPSCETRGSEKSGGKRVKFLRQGWQGWQHKYCQFVPYAHDSSRSELGVDRWHYERCHVPTEQWSRDQRLWLTAQRKAVQEAAIMSTESIRRRGRYSVGTTFHFDKWDGPGPWM